MIRNVINRLMRWARKKSIWVLHFNAGSCNGCDIEFLSVLTPNYDIERFGMLKEGTPRHADVLICTGSITRQIRDRLVRIYQQMPEPKYVVVVGSCGASGGVFSGAYNILGGIDQVIPVDVYIPGCPCRPEAIIEGLLQVRDSV